METGTLFNIQRFSLHDGPGIRTTVFFKGCPLDCLWCHNPESKSPVPCLAFYTDKCVLCGLCAQTCAHHTVTAEDHFVDRDKCAVCGHCAKCCPRAALEVIGRTYSVSEVMNAVLKDRRYYEASGGGITLSGGEPLFQPRFALALLTEAKREGLHTCVDTSGFASFSCLEAIAPQTDLFLFDIKETNDALHQQYTGKSNEEILSNLARLDSLQSKIILRCPIVPELNARDDHYDRIAEIANSLSNLVQIDIMPYHILGSSKSGNIGRTYPLAGLLPLSEEEKMRLIDRMAAQVSVPVH